MTLAQDKTDDDARPMNDLSRDAGAPLELQAHRGVLLNGEQRTFLVEAGALDLFAVALDQGRPTGRRVPLFRVGPGELAFGLGNAPAPIGVIAVPAASSTVRTLPAAQLSAAAAADPRRAADLADRVRTWVNGLCASLAPAASPRAHVEPHARTTLVLEPGDSTGSARELVWVRPVEGEIRFLGKLSVPAREPSDPGGVLPHSDAVWLEATERARLEVVDGAQLLRSLPVDVALEPFHALCRSLLAAFIEERSRGEQDALRRQIESERTAVRGGLQRIAALLLPASRAGAAGGVVADPLVAACEAVGQHLGIAIRAPARVPGEDADPEAFLESIARASRTRLRRVLLRGRWWHAANGPLLAFVEQGARPVALIPSGERRYLQRNFDGTPDRIVDEHSAAALAPFAVQLYRSLPDSPVTGRELLRFALAGSGRDLGKVLLLGAASAALSLLIPVSTGIVFNDVIPEAGRGQLAQVAVVLIVCTLAAAVFDATRSLALLRIGTRADAVAQAAVMNRLLALPASFFREQPTGDLADRALGVSAIRQTLSTTALEGFVACLFALVNLPLMFWCNWRLALVATGLMALGAGVAVALGVLQVRGFRVVATLEGRITAMILQFISGISKLRVAGAEDLAFSQWAEQFSEQRRVAYRVRTLSNAQSVFNVVFPGVLLLGLFAWVSGRANQPLSTGDFLVFLAASNNLVLALLQVAALVTGSLAVVPMYERLRPLLAAAPEVDEDKAPPGELAGSLEVREVAFRYRADGPLILDGVSLEARPGEFIALVGGSGCGKSTLLRLLLGFETPASGSVYYDGKDLFSLDVREVRRQVGVVLQNGSVVPGTILQNILGTASLSVDDAWEAARQAGLEEDIKAMPMGMHTLVTPGGGTLSGGQRQRLLIARALVRRPRLIFLDEATSALDNRTQEVVTESLGRLKATRIVIAHRLSTIVNADRIYVLERGRVVEQGTYQELLERNGPFAALVRRQIL